MKTIPLTRGVVAWVDDQDFDLVSAHKWHAHFARNGRWYAKTNVPCDPIPGGRKGRQTALLMHRLILNCPRDKEGDHIKHRPADEKVVDNRRSNLRVVTRGGNLHNGPKRHHGSGQYKGTTRIAGKPQGSIFACGRRHHLGRYKSEVEAAYAYDMGALYFFGETACTNFPLPGATVSLRDTHELTADEIAQVAWRVMGRLAVTDTARLAV